MRYELTDVTGALTDAKKRLGDKSPWGLDWIAFPQTWGSTAIGLGGLGGSTTTSAQTIIAFKHPIETCPHVVYFGGRFAYQVDKPNEKFFEDIKDWHMASVRDSGRYRREI